MALRNAFENLGLDSTLQAIRDRLPAALGGSGGVKVEQQGALPSGANTIGNVKVIDAAGANQAAVSAAGAVKVDGSAATQPVSGTVTANQGGTWNVNNVSGTVSLPTNAATSIKQSDGSQKSQIVDGSGNVIGSTANALDINIKSGGTAAGTQYAEGATAATATGTLALGKNGTTLKATQTDASGNLRVDLSQTSANATAIKVDGSAATQPVSGTVTANAGTNLNTSALALDATLTGGNQQVQGNVASGASDSGNPVKAGGRYNSTKPTFTDGQRGDLQLGTKGALTVQLQAADSATAINSYPDNVDAVTATSTVNKIGVQARNTVFNGTTWDRQPGSTVGTYNVVRDAAGNARGANVTAANALLVDGSAATQPVSGTVTSTQAATTSNVGAYNMTDAVFNGTNSLTPKFATIVASASGATTVVAAVGGKRIRVLQVVLIANTAVNVKFQSHVTPTDITGLFYLTANSGFSSGYSPVGQFQTVSGEALDINLSGAVAVGGYLTYVEV